MTENEKLAMLLFGRGGLSVEDCEARYPERRLPEGARVTRFSPSPTGYLHIGGLFGALADVLTARASGGVSYLRIEDTDKKREVDGGVEAVLSGFESFGIEFDEGVTDGPGEKGDYGPYIQSRRVDIYHAVARRLVEQGKAYPCFCSGEQLADIRRQQEDGGAAITGYFGSWARCRDLSLEECGRRISAGEPYVLRFRSPGDENRRVAFDDIVRGRIEMPENIIDEVLLKSDGIPTYHFAHVCDDHFMRTTHVIRAEEWISSVPKHLALFKACGFKAPKYAHTPQVMKTDEQTGAKRKLSKRKDPEAAVSYFIEKGYPAQSVTEYLMTLLNSNFEDWRRANPDAPASDFPFNLKKMSVSGCLFDLAKLNDVSKNIISRMSADELLCGARRWAQSYDAQLFSLLCANREYALGIFSIDRGGAKPRKDIACWSELRGFVEYFYDELYSPDFTLPDNISCDDAARILEKYIAVFDIGDDRDEWFAKIKAMCEPLGYTPNVKEYKKNPQLFKGHVGDVSTVIRVAVTSRRNTPDLHSIIGLLGRQRVEARLQSALEYYSNR